MPLFNPVTPAEIGALAAVNNLDDVDSASTARTNLNDPKVYNVRDYGALGNGVQLNGHGTMTSASAVYSDSGAAFTSADVGKSIVVYGAASAGGNLRTTISAYTSATQVTLAAAAGTSVTTANARYGTNDQAAIQAAINAAFSAGSGRVWFPRGFYILAGSYAQIPGMSDNGQFLLYVPYNPFTGPRVTVIFEGETDILSLPLSATGYLEGATVLFNLSSSTPAPGSSPYPSVLGAGNNVHNNVTVAIHDLTIRQEPAQTYSNTVSGINLYSVPNYELWNVRVDVDFSFSSGAPSSIAVPDPSTVSRSCNGISTTITNVNAGLGYIRAAVIGYAVGVDIPSQCEADQLVIGFCHAAVQLSGAEGHAKLIRYLNTFDCPHVFSATGTVVQLACECADLQGNASSVWAKSLDHWTGGSGATVSGFINATVNNYPSAFTIAGGATTGHLYVVTLDGTTSPLPVPLGAGGTGQSAASNAALLADLGAQPLGDFSGIGGPSLAGLGLALMTGSLFAAGFGNVQLTNEEPYLSLVTAAETKTISTLGVLLKTAGATAGAGVNVMALFTEAGSQVAITADMTAALEGAAGWIEGTLTSDYTITEGDNYYLAILTSFTTSPIVDTFGTALTAFELNGHYLWGKLATTETAMPATITPSSLTLLGYAPAMYAR